MSPLLNGVLLAGLLAAGAAETEGTNGMVLVDFGDHAVAWNLVNDGVMGGVSHSSIERTADGTGRFHGDLSLEYNGGFASVRADIDPVDPAAADGLEVRVRGDGRTYQLRLRTNSRFDGVAYRAFFATEAGEWTTERIAFDDFEPSYRGRIVPEAGMLDPARIRQLGFLLADKRAGRFELEIDWVRTWKAGEERPE